MLHQYYSSFIIFFFSIAIISKITVAMERQQSALPFGYQNQSQNHGRIPINNPNEQPANVVRFMADQRAYMYQRINQSYFDSVFLRSTPSFNDHLIRYCIMIGLYCVSFFYEKLKAAYLNKKSEQETPRSPLKEILELQPAGAPSNPTI